MMEAATHGMGFETASIGELTQSLNTGVEAGRIVFDSPVKTRRELQMAVDKGVHINFDNWQVHRWVSLFVFRIGACIPLFVF